MSVIIRYLESQSCKVVASSPKASWPCIEHNFSDAFPAVFMFCLLHSRGQGVITGHLFQLDSSVISKGPPRDFQFSLSWSETLCSCRLCFTFSLNCWSWSLIPILILPSSWLDCDATRRQVGSREVDGGGLSLRRPPLIPPTNLPPGHPTPQDHSSPHFSMLNKGVCWSTSKAIQSED